MPAGASPSAWARSMWLALNGSHGVIASSIGNATTVPSYEVYDRAFQLREVGSASAVAIVTHRRTTRR